MAPGFFSKVGDFFKKGFEFVKEKIVKPVAKTVSKVWEFAKPIAKPALQMLGQRYGVPAEVSGAALNIGEGLVGKLSGDSGGAGCKNDKGFAGGEWIVDDRPQRSKKGGFPAPNYRRRMRALADTGDD
jgi:hypothetical protein